MSRISRWTWEITEVSGPDPEARRALAIVRLRRIGYLFSRKRLQTCRFFFSDPVWTFIRFALIFESQFSARLRSGKCVQVSKKDRNFWDWFLAADHCGLDVTSDGEIQVEIEGVNFFLQPGSVDFYTLREVFLADAYGLRLFPEPLSTVIDIGANVGFFACAALSRAKRVIAVEPVEENYRYLMRHVTVNGGSCTDVLRYAVTGRSQEAIRLYRGSKRTTRHSIDRQWAGNEAGYETVSSIALPELMQKVSCGIVDLLKCDAEGAEYEIFLNTSIEDLTRINALLIEVHVSDAFPLALVEALFAHLKQAGFRVIVPEGFPSRSSGKRQTCIVRAVR